MKISRAIQNMIAHCTRVNIRDVDAWDDAVDSMLESASQKSKRLRAQIKRCEQAQKGDIDNANSRKAER